MRHLRRIHTAALILLGLAIVAWVYGFDRQAVVPLLVVEMMLIVSLEILRAREPGDHP